MKTAQLDSFEKLRDVIFGYMIDINEDQLALFKKYHDILLKWNKRINLISRKEQNIIEKHFLDSILFLPEITDLARASARPAPTVFDIGSGGGFPGIPLAIMKPNWHFTLCESIKKKATFLEHLIKELDLKNIDVVNARVENVRAIHELPLQYDFVTARAVAKLDELIKYAMPLLKKGGYLLAYKAKEIDDEIKNAKKIIEKNKLILKIFSKEINGVERKLVVLSHPCYF